MLLASAAAFGGLGVHGALAQDANDIAAIRREMETMRQEYDARIEALEARLKNAEAEAVAVAPVAKSTPVAVATPPPQPTPSPVQRAPVGVNAFNPAISVVLNGSYAAFENDPEMAGVPGFNLGEEAGLDPEGFSLGESEVALTANIDHKVAGTLIFALTDEGEAEVEEGYIEATSLPGGFTAKAGKFFSGIGYLNEKHSHNWDFIDQPLPYRVFLGNQYGDAGVQVRWLAPLDRYVEFGGEWFRGDSFPASGAADNGKGTYAGYVTTGGDLGVSSSWLAKVSYLHTQADEFETEDGDIFSGNNDLGIASFVYKWAPNGNPTSRNLIVNGEYFFGNEKGDFNGVPINMDRHGWYGQAVYQFRRNWRVGARYARIGADAPPVALSGSAIDVFGRSPDAISALIEYDTSEFSRFRLMYTYDDADLVSNNELIVRYTVIFGPHGAHRF
ncbi:MAG: TonB-dependent receptor [Hyphococcus sp.]|nr:MAG: TonB-dependent receptor [Marinicaulis sp.]